jgi:hypothetical protein
MIVPTILYPQLGLQPYDSSTADCGVQALAAWGLGRGYSSGVFNPRVYFAAERPEIDRLGQKCLGAASNALRLVSASP